MVHASFESSPRLQYRQIAAIALASLIGLAGLLVTSAASHNFGFPLDDAWIHATYARNLAQLGDWMFRPGMGSAGSTSPLWTFLLVPGYWLGLAPLWWSHLVSFGCLVVLAATAEVGVRRLNHAYQSHVPWVGLLVGTEWHLLWASASGMETILHACLLTTVLTMMLTGSRRYAAMGLLTGLSVWVRPDGLTLAAPVLFVLAFAPQGRSSRLRAVLEYSVGLGALLLPYLVFNLRLAGTPFPNTFYAKQAEYVGWQSRSVLYRLGLGLLQLSTGPMLVLLPAIVIELVAAVRSRNASVLAAWIWSFAYMGIYVLRLPPYQHARYLIPAMPVLLIIGALGLIRFREMRWPGARHWMLQWAWNAALVMTQIGFWILGARAYAADVALIQTEMVNTATWVADHLRPDAVVAAHDIGALGYFDDHALIDLAGLVSPEVIPFIRNEDRLAEYLDARGATYLIAFPSLYPQLEERATVLHSSGGTLAPSLGQGNLTVYCWRCP